MSGYVLSSKAAADIETIARASVREWGLNRAIGQGLDALRPGIMKILTGSHLVFYRKRQGGVMIVRILHRRMDFAPAITS